MNPDSEDSAGDPSALMDEHSHPGTGTTRDDGNYRPRPTPRWFPRVVVIGSRPTAATPAVWPDTMPGSSPRWRLADHRPLQRLPG